MIINADAIQWAKEYEGELFHALICDPPYHLQSLGKPRPDLQEYDEGKGNPYARQQASTGFMQTSWDGGNIAFQPKTWKAFYNILLPGAFGMAFGGSRTAHRMAVAIEDAGFIIFPMIAWVTGQSFPKAHRVTYDSKQFCQCDYSPPQSPQNDSQDSELGANRKDVDSQLNYLKDSYQNDEQLQSLSMDGQDTEPLPTDVSKHNHSCVTLIEIRQGNESLHIPFRVQHIHRLSKTDCPCHSVSASQLSQGYTDVKYPDSDSKLANRDGNEAVSLPSIDRDGDTSASDNQHKHNSGFSFPYDSPLEGSRSHYTTGCPKCGKIKKEVWEGHRYGMQVLKNAVEPIIVFQKPYEGRPVDSITETGAGAINIDGGRIGLVDIENHTTEAKSGLGKSIYGEYENKPIPLSDLPRYNKSGRWPSNFCLTHSAQCQMIGYRDSDSYQINRFTDGAKPFGDGAGHEFESEEVEGGRVPVWECVEGCPVLALDRQSGHLAGAGNKIGTPRKSGSFFSDEQMQQNFKYDKGGTASRFFHQSHWAIENADPFVYQAKVSVSERNAGLSNQVHDIGHNTRDVCSNCGGRIFQNKDRPSACTCDDQKRVHEKVRNPHPTLKPIALIEHLATLLLPPKEYAPRRIFVPFAGVSSEVIGCWRAGWEEITGIELESEYAEIGKARLEYWKKQGVQLDLFEEK